jgi:hypothetical protein
MSKLNDWELENMREVDAPAYVPGQCPSCVRLKTEAAGWFERAEAATAEVEHLRVELALNASMLARQCDMAREAETKQAQAEAALAELEAENVRLGDAGVTERQRAEQAETARDVAAAQVAAQAAEINAMRSAISAYLTVIGPNYRTNGLRNILGSTTPKPEAWRDALEWYGDKRNYETQINLQWAIVPVFMDRGKRARAALAAQPAPVSVSDMVYAPASDRCSECLHSGMGESLKYPYTCPIRGTQCTGWHAQPAPGAERVNNANAR